MILRSLLTHPKNQRWMFQFVSWKVSRCRMKFQTWHFMKCFHVTGWQRCIRCLKFQVSFRKRATNCRARWRKISYKDKASYGSLPPCTSNLTQPLIHFSRKRDEDSFCWKNWKLKSSEMKMNLADNEILGYGNSMQSYLTARNSFPETRDTMNIHFVHWIFSKVSNYCM